MTDWRDYENMPTIDLIELIKMNNKPEHLGKSQAAFHVFCFRFELVIAKKVEIICKNNDFYNRVISEEIIECTFKRFWKYPKFDLKKMNIPNIDKGVELYLFRIAQHCYTNLFNEHHGIRVSPYNGQEHIIDQFPKVLDLEDIDNDKLLIVKRVLDSFSWKHRVIYLTYLQYDENGYNLPRKLLAELRDKLGLSQTTIRNYRFEVINKIKDYTELWQEKKTSSTARV